MDKKTAQELLEQYPTWIPHKIAGPILGVSPRRLSWLIASGRKPYCDLGANIGINQNYVRVYTDRLIKYVCGEDLQ